MPQPPGGTSDILARVLALKLAESLRQQIIIDNRAGASGTIGTDLAAKSPPDGYTLVCIHDARDDAGIYGNCHTSGRRLAPITLAAAAPLLLVVHPKIPVTSVKE